MARAKKICAKPGCPAITAGTHCPPHAAEAERARGSRESRGYGPEHRALRKRWAPMVATGDVLCAKCDQPIKAGTVWHLGHTADRATWTGPEHPYCNLSDAGRRSHKAT